MEEVILLKMGETVLKGLNRRSFEARFLRNLKNSLNPIGPFDISISQSTVYASPAEDGVDMDAAFRAAKRVFGAVAVSRAAVCAKDVDAIFNTAKEYLRPELMSVNSFKVESKRADKTFPLTSIALSQEIGGRLQDVYPHLKPDMHHPEFQTDIEIRDTAAYIHARSHPGAGGMPVGSNGRAAVLLSGGIDSPVAAWMMAKRGLELICVHFASPPYTSERALDKVLKLAGILTEWTGPIGVFIVPFTQIQTAIRDSAPGPYNTVIMRRSMMRIASALAKQNHCGALITGESLGQVASQTMQAITITEDAAALPVFRPLIGMDKEEIVTLARKIETFETSILPYEDCCTVFTPQHPKTKPRLDETLTAEALINFAELESQAILDTEKQVIGI
ncbi:MAG: tRNA 4-thiouridine(8) synthase ThiI [Clostridiales bacterium]|jgi:thiamine biosynthesis protein ThiI|nr:tRNA 4-thiouridine(8) synthase ThiI [Clostridiales bacterium]